ncbi:MAG: hypothetical protein ACPGQL_10485 [Thermoplasmatota archaeon]
MVAARTLVVLALLAATGGLLWALADDGATGPAGASRHSVTVSGPGDEMWFNGTIDLANGTALDALLAVAADQAWSVDTEAYAFGDCGTYVVAVRGERAHGSQGWIFEVWDADDQAWQWATRGASCWYLEPEQAVRWRWSEAPGS